MANARPLSYSVSQKTLHWIVALAVIGLVPVGKFMADRGAAGIFDALTNTLYVWHKAIGFTVLLLMIIRIALKFGRGTPAPVETLSPVERLVSGVVHNLIYVLLVLTPLLGWAGVTAFPALITVGGYHLPPMPFVPQDQALAKQIFALHGLSAMALVVLSLMHIGAALMHRVVKKDAVFARMWPS
jgi:cytochrome b561